MLVAQEVSVAFGGVVAVNGVSFELQPDEVLGLVGPNGSGKTTLVNALCGVVRASGTIAVDGQNLRSGSARSARRAGIARVFQAPQTFGELSCIDNVLLSSADLAATGLTSCIARRRSMTRHERGRWIRAMQALEDVGLANRARADAGLLTYGQRRLLELARAIAGDPKLLILDEPSAGLNDSETANLKTLLLDVHARGLPLLLIDHKVDFVDALCDRVLVLELGSLIAAGTPEEIWKDPRVVSAYLGLRVEDAGN
jgi:branched-chain amino acid transport system ATP-binding protein